LVDPSDKKPVPLIPTTGSFLEQVDEENPRKLLTNNLTKRLMAIFYDEPNFGCG